MIGLNAVLGQDYFPVYSNKIYTKYSLTQLISGITTVIEHLISITRLSAYIICFYYFVYSNIFIFKTDIIFFAFHSNRLCRAKMRTRHAFIAMMVKYRFLFICDICGWTDLCADTAHRAAVIDRISFIHCAVFFYIHFLALTGYKSPENIFMSNKFFTNFDITDDLRCMFVYLFTFFFCKLSVHIKHRQIIIYH